MSAKITIILSVNEEKAEYAEEYDYIIPGDDAEGQARNVLTILQDKIESILPDAIDEEED